MPRREWDETVRARAARARRATDPADAQGITLPPLRRTDDDGDLTYDHVRVALDRDARTATLVVAVPGDVPTTRRSCTSSARRTRCSR